MSGREMTENRTTHILRTLKYEIGGVGPRYLLSSLLFKLLPDGCNGRLRTVLYRMLGMQVGPQTLIMGRMTITGPKYPYKNIHIGPRCFINTHVYIDAGAPVTIGTNVTLGHHVIVITSDHEIGPPVHRAGELKLLPVVIEDGAWIAARVTLLPGVTVGAGSVVAAGAVVTKNIPPNMLVGGVPARIIRNLDSPD